MKRRRDAAWLVTCVLFSATRVFAQADGPLQTTQAELKSLPASKANAESIGRQISGSAVPQLHLTSPEVVPAEMTNPSQRARELPKESEAKKNWLVDGVQQLARVSTSKDDGAGRHRELDVELEKTNEGSDEQSAPSSLLEVYIAQQKQAERKEERAERLSAPVSDPLAPFLQDWMGNSPVRGKFFDEFAGHGKAVTPSIDAGYATEPSRGAELSQSLPTGVLTGTTSPAQNPYLREIELPAAREVPAVAPSPPSSFTVGGSSPIGRPAPVVPGSNEVQPRQTARESKTAIPTPENDRKYFPQLKKF